MGAGFHKPARNCKLQIANCKLQIEQSGAAPRPNLHFAICILQFALYLCPMLLVAGVVCGCKKDDMAEQPRAKEYEPTEVFADGTEARPLVGGVVARPPRDTPGIPYAKEWAHGGVGAPDQPTSDTIPLTVNEALIRRGQQRYNIYCAVCHGRLGNGNGMIVQRGFIRPPSFHNPRLSDPTKTKDSHFYDVISNGYGAMFSYAERVQPNDRWAIAAYIRTLQESVRQSLRDRKITPQEYKALQGERP